MLLALMATAEVPSIAALKGPQVAVDAMTTGFAFLLREALLKSGMALSDINFTAVGGGAQRLAWLSEKKFAATLLNAPLDLIAEARGAKRLADMRGLIGPYQGISSMARRPWLAANKAAAVSFTKGLRASVAWLCDPTNKAEAIGILRTNLPTTTPELAEKIYARLTHPTLGIRRDLSLDIAGIETVLRLRTAFATQPKQLNDPSRYIDLSVLAAAN
jgi:ABC-type nitrate/sulfonate/bicarbonate transport system substrate-binding protein